MIGVVLVLVVPAPDLASSLVQSSPTVDAVSTSVGCLFGLAVECATARLSMRTGLISCTEPGTNPARGVKLGQARMPINILGSQ